MVCSVEINIVISLLVLEQKGVRCKLKVHEIKKEIKKSSQFRFVVFLTLFYKYD